MSISLDSLLPLVILGVIGFTMYSNHHIPKISPSGNTVIKPEVKYNVFREEAKDHDNKVTITHVASGDKLGLMLWRDYLLLPDGEKSIPTRTDENGKQIPIWSIGHTRTEVIFDLGWDIGAYGGYLTGKTEDHRVNNFDAGVKFSPIRIWNSFSPDILASGQGLGLGLSFYPRPETYGEIWDHMGIGYGRFYTVRDDTQRNLFYFTLSTKF